jgi:prolyl 4-hydroxylase
MEQEHLDNSAFVVHHLLSDAECDEFLQKIKAQQFEPARTTLTFGGEAINDPRTNSRIQGEDEALATRLWERSAKYFWPLGRDEQWKPNRLNTRFSYYRYQPGEQFKTHYDRPWSPTEDESSFYTYMVYLNDDFEGGNTSFYTGDDYGFCRFFVKPEKGMLLAFKQLDNLHEGGIVTAGEKYVLRSDVMFKRKS